MFICVDYHFTFRTLHEGVVKLDACTCQVIICLRFKALLHYQDVTKDTFLVTKIEGEIHPFIDFWRKNSNSNHLKFRANTQIFRKIDKRKKR